MKTQDYSIKYIIVNVISVPEWAELSYRCKKAYHHLITVSGKSIPLKPLEPIEGCIEIVFVGSDEYAQDSGALFALLLDLWVEHPDAKIVYADELYNIHNSCIVSASRWLIQRMPRWLRRKFPRCRNLLRLRALLPFII